MKKFDQHKTIRYIEGGLLLKLKHYIIEFEKKNITFSLNFKSGKSKETPLHIACSFGDDAIVRCLIKHGAKVDVKDRRGNSPLHAAAQFVLDNKMYGSYKLLIDPLLKQFPEGLHKKNHEGFTPVDLLNIAKQNHLQKCQEERINRSSEESSSDDEDDVTKETVTKETVNKEKVTKEEEGTSWDEKLANEMDADCADFSEKFSAGSWPKQPTFSDWADRIASEYQRKHRYDNTSRKSNRTTKRQKIIDSNNEKIHLIQRKEMFMKHQKIRKECELERKHLSYQDRFQKLKTAATKSEETKKLKFKDIPWPCRGTMDEMLEVVTQGLKQGCDTKERKKFFKRQLFLWHPDKFRQSFINLLDDGDKDVILDTVKLLSQRLTELLNSVDQ